ncbi:MAG TPA: hypothetical protein VMY35_11315 [Phycisphaerae bacterium]|nr:hypothetical protein [Phycisphaerae bacterium]
MSDKDRLDGFLNAVRAELERSVNGFGWALGMPVYVRIVGDVGDLAEAVGEVAMILNQARSGNGEVLAWLGGKLVYVAAKALEMMLVMQKRQDLGLPWFRDESGYTK